MQLFGVCQQSYGGGAACSTIATIWAAALADGACADVGPYVAVDRFRIFMKFACQLWRKANAGVQSAHEVLGMYPIFNGYESESFAFALNCSHDPARPPLKTALTELLREARKSKGAFGGIATAQGSSWAFGHVINEGWILLDSHNTTAGLTHCADAESLVASIIHKCLNDLPCFVDITTVWRKTPLAGGGPTDLGRSKS